MVICVGDVWDCGEVAASLPSRIPEPRDGLRTMFGWGSAVSAPPPRASGRGASWWHSCARAAHPCMIPHKGQGVAADLEHRAASSPMCLFIYFGVIKFFADFV